VSIIYLFFQCALVEQDGDAALRQLHLVLQHNDKQIVQVSRFVCLLHTHIRND
jgi:hypothetical protein